VKAREIFNNYYDRGEEARKKIVDEYNRINFPKKYPIKYTCDLSYKKLIDKLSDKELDLIIKYSKNRINGAPIHSFYFIIPKIILARKNLDKFVSGNLSNYSTNYNNKIKQLKDNIANGIETEEHTIILPGTKRNIHQAIKRVLNQVISKQRIRSFILDMEKLFK